MEPPVTTNSLPWQVAMTVAGGLTQAGGVGAKVASRESRAFPGFVLANDIVVHGEGQNSADDRSPDPDRTGDDGKNLLS